MQGRGGGVPLREEADSPLHRRHPHGERAGPGWARCSPGSCFPSSPSPRPSAAHWRKSVLQLLGEAAFSPTGPTNSPLQWAPRYPWRAPSPAPRVHFEVLSSPGLPPFHNPGPLETLLCLSTRLGEGLKELGRLGPTLYRNHLPSGRLNYLEMSQLHCYLCIFCFNTIAITT